MLTTLILKGQKVTVQLRWNVIYVWCYWTGELLASAPTHKAPALAQWIIRDAEGD